MFKKFLAKKVARKTAEVGIKKEAKILVGAVLTIATHKLIQKAARSYPSLSFLRVREKA